jgi:hypothetical protein
MMNNKDLSEADIRTMFITAALVEAGWEEMAVPLARRERHRQARNINPAGRIEFPAWAVSSRRSNFREWMHTAGTGMLPVRSRGDRSGAGSGRSATGCRSAAVGQLPKLGWHG